MFHANADGKIGLKGKKRNQIKVKEKRKGRKVLRTKHKEFKNESKNCGIQQVMAAGMKGQESKKQVALIKRLFKKRTL